MRYGQQDIKHTNCVTQPHDQAKLVNGFDRREKPRVLKTLVTLVGSLVILAVGPIGRCPGQTFKRLPLPAYAETGAYHGKMWVHDAAFVNNDRQALVVVNESIIVFDTATGKRIHTLLNRQLHETAGGIWGDFVRNIHLVDDGKSVLTDPWGVWNMRSPKPNDTVGYRRGRPQRWFVWDASNFGNRAPPGPTPFFRREGRVIGESEFIENRLLFIKQVGDDFVFLFNFKYDTTVPPSIRTYRQGDHIDRPRQEIPLEHDDNTVLVALREPWRPPFLIGENPLSTVNEPLENFVQCRALEFRHDPAGNLQVSHEKLELSNDSLKFVVRGQDQVHGIGLFFNIPKIRSNFLAHHPQGVFGLVNHSESALAVRDGLCELAVPLRKRSRAPVTVNVYDRETRRLLQQCPCGKGSSARPLAFSSNDKMLLTVHDLERPDLRLWGMNASVSRGAAYRRNDGIFERRTTESQTVRD